MRRLLGLVLSVAVVAGGGASGQPELADNVPDSFDWYSHQLVTRVLNQHTPKYCQSSWALSAMGALADRIKIARAAQLVAQGPDIHLAVQVLLNCAGGVAGNCSSGSPADAYRFVQDFGGVAYESCQPYEADDTRGCGGASVCHSCTAEGCFSVHDGDQRDVTRLGTFTTALPKAQVADWGVVSGELAMQQEILAHGPIVCAASATALSEYTGGVLTDDGVRAEENAQPQYVAVVGWGRAEDSSPYWRIRNSWGEFWGETGFYRSARGGNGVDSSPCFWATPGSWMQTNTASDGVHVVDFDRDRAASFWQQVELRTMIQIDDDPAEVQDTDANVFVSGVSAFDDVVHGSLTGVGFALVVGIVLGVVISSKGSTNFHNCFRSPTYGEYVPIGSDHGSDEGEYEDDYYFEYEFDDEAGSPARLEEQESPATYH